MIRIKLCQQLSSKFDFFRTSFSSAAISLDSPTVSSPHNATTLTHRSKCTRAAHWTTLEPSSLLSSGEEKTHPSDTGFCPQSITPFRFDDTNNFDYHSNTTCIHVLKQWKELLDNLKSIVGDLHCTGTAVHDVSAVRMTLERHCLVKFFVKPYSYTSDDVLKLVPGELSCDTWNLHDEVFDKSESDSAVVPLGNDIISHHCAAAGVISVLDKEHANENTDDDQSVLQKSCISRLEQESLRAVMVLSSAAWKDRLEDVAWPHVEEVGLLCMSGPEVLQPKLSPVMMCQLKDKGSEQLNSTNLKGVERPNRDHLSAVQDYLAENLPKIFEKFHSYDIYTNNVIFENNWYLTKSYTTVGILSYALEIAKLRLFVHLKYANVKMSLLKITTHEEDGTVRIRWRISGIPQTQAIMFWKFLPWGDRSSPSVDTEWLDGFSIFYVDGSGLIFKHKMDRVIPDEGLELKTSKTQTVIEKLASRIAAPSAI